MNGPTTTRGTTTALGAGLRPASSPNRHQRHRAAHAALVALWSALEDMPEDDAAEWLNGPARAFLLGLDASAVLDALTRDRARRAAMGAGS